MALLLKVNYGDDLINQSKPGERGYNGLNHALVSIIKGGILVRDASQPNFMR